jgi:hypothetical protein
MAWISGPTSEATSPRRRPGDAAQLRVLYGALIAGAAIFTGMVVALSLAGIVNPAPGSGPPMFVLYAAWGGVAVGSVVVAVVVARKAPAFTAQSLAGAADAEAHVAGSFFVMTLLSGALLEAAALFGGVIVLLTAEPLNAIMAAAPLAVMIAMFPTRRRWERFRRRALGLDEPETEPRFLPPEDSGRDFRSYR